MSTYRDNCKFNRTYAKLHLALTTSQLLQRPEMIDWASAEPEEAAKMLREIRNNPESAQKRAMMGKAFMEEHFSIATFKKSIDAFLDGKL